MNTLKMIFHVEARHVDARGTFARCKNADIATDTAHSGVRRWKEAQT